MFKFEDDRSKYPEKNPDGTNIIDLESGKFTKIWQGPIHPGMTGNMSLELIIQGDEVMECKTHVGYLHRGFEKLMEAQRARSKEGSKISGEIFAKSDLEKIPAETPGTKFNVRLQAEFDMNGIREFSTQKENSSNIESRRSDFEVMKRIVRLRSL